MKHSTVKSRLAPYAILAIVLSLVTMAAFAVARQPSGRTPQALEIVAAAGLAALVAIVLMLLRQWQQERRELGASPQTLRAIIDSVAAGKLDDDAEATPRASGLHAAVLSMRDRMRASREADGRALLEYERLRAALDSVNVHVMVANADNDIVYLNRTAQRMFETAEPAIRQEIPGFRADALLGSSMDLFHSDPDAIRDFLVGLDGEHSGVMTLGGESFQLIVHIVRSKCGELLGSVVEWKNLSEEKRRNEEERRHNRQVAQILDAMGSLRFSVDSDGLLTDVNTNAASFLGYSRSELLGRPLEDIMVDGLTVASIKRLAVNGAFQKMRGLLKQADGALLPVDLSGLAAFGEGASGQPQKLLLLAQPAARRGRELLISDDIVDCISDGIALVDRDWRILSMNRAFGEITQLAVNETFAEAVPERMPEFGAGSESGSAGGWEGEISGRRRDGSEFVVFMTLRSLGDADGGENCMLTIRDITRLKESEKHIRELAYTDTLTGLANRAEFERRVAESIKRSHRRGERFAILYFDLDGFKYINDSLGHAAGDQMLKTVGTRLRGAIRETDFAARIGGDEFCVLAENIEREHDAAKIASKCLDAVTAETRIAARPMRPEASVGIAFFPDDGGDHDALMQSADSAMYAAKQSGSERFAFYSADMTVAAQRRLALEQALRAALDNDEFELVYQPQIELGSGRMIGVESLIRWRHPTRGVVPPGEFIDVAEKIGLIEDLGVWVLRTACNQAVEWERKGLPPLSVAVNISGSHFEDGKILRPTELILAETGLEPGRLELEVTETVVQTNMQAAETFDQLKRLGVRMAIDDFGTGYSCLDSIRRLPLHRLKIDRVFVNDLLADSDNSSIIATIIAMGRAMSLEVVAEGVEHLEQVIYLRGLGCDVVQGFYFSKPVSAKEIEALADTSFLPGAGRQEDGGRVSTP